LQAINFATPKTVETVIAKSETAKTVMMKAKPFILGIGKFSN
jgi:hypothetical protein